MLSGLRSIFFQNTLRWPPLEGYAIKKEAIRNLYNKLFEPGGYRYENLDLQTPLLVLSTRHPGDGLSACRFGPSSLTIEEKKTKITLEGFTEVVTTVLGNLNEDDVPPFFLQECRIQCLAQPSNVENSLVLLAAKVARVYEHVKPFGRPPGFFGVRFRFAPVVLVEGAKEGDAQGNADASEQTSPTKEVAISGRQIEKKGFVTVRFETHTEDPSQVWMEVVATYPETDPLLTLRDTQRIVDNIRETHVFLAERSKQFLDQFDTKSDNDDSHDE